MAEKPYMEVTFRQRAVSFMERSQRGIAALIIRDATDETEYKEYRNITEALADKEKYTEANLQAIKDVFNSAPYKLAVVRIAGNKGIETALTAIADNLDTCRIGVARAVLRTPPPSLLGSSPRRRRAEPTRPCSITHLHRIVCISRTSPLPPSPMRATVDRRREVRTFRPCWVCWRRPTCPAA